MKTIYILIFFSIPCTVFGQMYENALGIRAGQTRGIEYRLYTDDANSYKFLLGSRDDGVQFHAFKEFHKYELFSFTDQLALVYGLGIHVGYEKWTEGYNYGGIHYYHEETAFLTGMDGLVGLEYYFYEIPISLGLELKPYFDLLGRDTFSFEPWDFAFTIKYLF